MAVATYQQPSTRAATTPQAPTYTTFKARNAVDAAEVGDKVSPGTLSVVCGSDIDALKVLYAGKMALSEFYRLGGQGGLDAVRIEQEAREAAVRLAYSCSMIRRYSAEPLLVEQKRISNGLLPTVTYILRNEQGLWYVKVEQNDNSPFEPVKRLKR
ncbi:MAG: hypothetical protein AUI16_30835 [Alphaproteobacteria bacterium 13_2_20CM_2_64_7]|nr:MAG: hypothetical protein AUI16_30835 [Alphaproteobacteria bacterium 13_2_20CM_2_64_7]